jgi:hypothetical protein
MRSREGKDQQHSDPGNGFDDDFRKTVLFCLFHNIQFIHYLAL